MPYTKEPVNQTKMETGVTGSLEGANYKKWWTF